MKNILLVRPPERYLPHRTRPMIYLPIGLLQIASVLIEKGYRVEVIDGIMPEKEIKDGGENFFGITFEDMKHRLLKKDFDIVGISAQFTFQWPNAVKMSELCKKINPDCKVVIGGAHVSVSYEDIIGSCDSVDVAVRAEGEYVMPQLVERIYNNLSFEGIPGIACKTGDKVFVSDNIYIDDLDSLPFPAYHLIDMKKYFSLIKEYSSRTAYSFDGWERGVSLITSRGCPFNCVFCSIHLHMGRKWRAHSLEYVLKHIQLLVEEYGIKYLHFEDDNISFDSKRFARILDGIIENGRDIRWDTPNGVRADTFDEKLLKKCKASGCTHLIFGVESGVQRVLNNVVRKSITLSKVEETMKLARKVGVDTRAFFMVGLPGETKEEIKATADYILKAMWKYECFGGLGMAVPLYGTQLYDICEEHDYFVREPAIDNLSAAFLNKGIIKTPEFDPDLLEDVKKYVTRKQPLLLFMLFLRKLLRHPWLIWHVLKNMLVLDRHRLSSVYNRVLFFQHAIEFDLKKEGRRSE